MKSRPKMRKQRATAELEAGYQHNNQVAVNRLPNEMIVQFFKQGLLMQNEECTEHQYMAKVAGTSCLWRDIALTTVSVTESTYSLY